jgi:hypothetical protein
MTKRVWTRILVSTTWLIAIFIFEINQIQKGGLCFSTDLFLIDYLLFGIFPLLVIWSIW